MSATTQRPVCVRARAPRAAAGGGLIKPDVWDPKAKGRGARKKPLNFAVWRTMAVRRLEGRRGRPLDVLVEWEGEESRVTLKE